MASRKKQDQRISPRKNLKTRIIFEDEFSEEFLYFLSTDISISGIFMESNIHLQLHTKLFLKFSLYENDKPVEVTGEVARINEPKRRPGRKLKSKKIGIGIRFLGLKADDFRRIERFIAS